MCPCSSYAAIPRHDFASTISGPVLGIIPVQSAILRKRLSAPIVHGAIIPTQVPSLSRAPPAPPFYPSGGVLQLLDGWNGISHGHTPEPKGKMGNEGEGFP